jgi:tetratricopeptide (TPR) repeat protein
MARSKKVVNKNLIAGLTLAGIVLTVGAVFVLVGAASRRDPEVWAREAKRFAEEKRYDRAAQYYWRAYEASRDPEKPTDRDVKYLIDMADVHYASGEPFRSLMTLQRAYVEKPSRVDVLRTILDRLWELQQFGMTRSSDMQKFGEAMVNAEPNDASGYAALAVAYNFRINEDPYNEQRAREALDKAREIDPLSPRVALAELMLRSRQYQQRIKNMTSESAIGAESNRFREEIFQVCEPVLQKDPASSYLVEIYTTELAALGRHDQVVQVFDRSLKAAPSDPNLLRTRALYAYSRLQVAKDAGERRTLADETSGYVERALEIEPGMLDLYQIRAALKLVNVTADAADAPAAYDEALGILKKGFQRSLDLKTPRADIDRKRLEHLSLLTRGFMIASQYPGALDDPAVNARRVQEMRWFADEAELRMKENPLTWFMKGSIALAQKDWNAAIPAIERANSSTDVLLLYRQFGRIPSEILGLLYREVNSPGEALRFTDKAMEQYRDDLRRTPPLILYLNRGELLNQLDRAQETLDMLDQVATTYPNDERLARVRAGALTRLGRSADAMALLESLGKSQGDVDILIQQATVATRAGDKKSAEEKLRAAFEIDPENEVVLTRLFSLIFGGGREPGSDERAQAFLDEARTKIRKPLLIKLLDSWQIAVREKDPARRNELFVKLLESEPDPFRRATDLYNFYISQNDAATAVKYLEEAEKLQPDDVRVLELQLGQALAGRDRAKADRYVARLTSLNADRAGGATYRGSVAATFGDLAMAQREFEDADRKLPESSGLKVKLAEVYFALGQTERAAEFAATATRINPQDPDGHKLLYRIRRHQGDTKAASESLAAALRLTPNDPALVAEKQFLEDERDPEGSLRTREALRAQRPDDVENLARLGELYGRVRKMLLDRGNAAKADEAWQRGHALFTESVSKFPTDVTLANAVRRFYADSGRPDQGYELLKKFIAAQTEPSGRIVGELIVAQLYEQVRRADQANAAFDRAEEIIRDSVTDAQQRRAGLVRLGFQRLGLATRSGQSERAQEIAEGILKQLDKSKPEERAFVLEAQREIARSLLARRKPVEAEAVLNDLLKLDQNDTSALMLRSEMWQQRGNLEKAVDDLSLVLISRPQDIAVRFVRGDHYGRLRRYAAAQEDLSKVKLLAAERPDDKVAQDYAMEARSRLVSLYEIQDQFELAERELREMLEIYGEKAGTELFRQRTADRLIALLLRANRAQKAEQVCAEYMAKFPRSADWPIKLGELLMKREQYGAAAERFQDAMKIAENENLDLYARAFAARLRALIKAGRVPDAKFIYENRPVKDVRPLVTLVASEVYRAAGDAAKADQVRRAALRDALERSGTALERVALDMSTNMSIDELMAAWESVVPETTDPVELARLRNIQARDLATSRRFEDALKYLDPGLKLADPTLREYNDALVLHAQILDQLNRVDEAIKAYEKILAEQPNEVAALNNLAYLLATKGKQPKAALQYVQTAMNLVRNDAPLALRDTHAWVLYLNGNLDEAEGRLREILNIDPYYTPALEHLARVLEETRRPAEAVKQYQVLRDVAASRQEAETVRMVDEALKRLQ